MIASLSAVFRLLLLLAWTLLLLPVYALTRVFGRGHRAVAAVYWRLVLRFVLRARVVCRGTPAAARPLLLVGNHSSYVDIVALSVLARGDFVARADMRGWPVIGQLAWLAGTVFVDRRPRAAGRGRDRLAARLAKEARKDGGRQAPLILFPESTTSDGNRVLPFKSSLFAVVGGPANGQPVTVQPFSVAYTHAAGLPIGHADRAFYCWYGDMELLPHLWGLLRRGPFTLEVAFLPPVVGSDFADRKALARHCEKVVRHGFAALLAGRAPDVTPEPLPA